MHTPRQILRNLVNNLKYFLPFFLDSIENPFYTEFMAVDTEWANRLSKAYAELTKTEKEFADYINENPHEAAFMSLREISEKSGISRPTIIEFFRNLGFSNFQEFKTSIQNFYRHHIDSYKASTITFKKIKTLSELLDSAVEIEIKSLKRMREYVNGDDLSAIAEKILKASSVYIFGPGTGFYPAHYLSQRLRRYRIDVHLIPADPQHLAEELYPMTEKDMLLVFNYYQNEKLFHRVMEWGKDTGSSVFMITEQVYPHLVNLADHVVYINRGDLEFKNSMALPMTFTNLILLTVEMLGEEKIKGYLKDLEKKREKFGLSLF